MKYEYFFQSDTSYLGTCDMVQYIFSSEFLLLHLTVSSQNLEGKYDTAYLICINIIASLSMIQRADHLL